MKLKSFCKAKDTVNRTKWQPIAREKILTKCIFDRELISKTYKEFKKLVINKLNNPNKIGYKSKYRILTKESQKTEKNLRNIQYT